MKFHIVNLCFLTFVTLNLQAAIVNDAVLGDLVESQTSFIQKSSWMHGAKQCEENSEPALDSYQHDDTSFILRQNKCLTFEAPFIYVLVGTKTVMVLDSGALAKQTGFSLYDELVKVLGSEQLASKKVLVVHSHGHSDHFQGDADFKGRKNVELVGVSATQIHTFFGFQNWPNGQASIDLGERVITVIPTPGHQEESLSFYDSKTQWLMTGDTLYPGLIYVKDWDAYKVSIDRLLLFTKTHTVSAVMGAHIEMKSQTADYYPVGTTYQPQEARLDLPVQSIQRLHEALTKAKKPQELLFDDFIVQPMNGFQKTLSNVFRWFSN